MAVQHSASGSIAEDMFFELFSEAFGADKAGYLYSQYHFYDIYQNGRYADFLLESNGRKVAIEIDDEGSHHKSLVTFGKFYDDLLKQNTTFSIRISSEDLATIRQKAKDARLSQSEYVTRCCLGRQIVIMDGLKEVLQQQRAIGNNLNRLTVLANMGRVTAVDLERTAQELATISSTLRDIQERARRSG